MELYLVKISFISTNSSAYISNKYELVRAKNAKEAENIFMSSIKNQKM